jgi:hypothetical protein
MRPLWLNLVADVVAFDEVYMLRDPKYAYCSPDLSILKLFDTFINDLYLHTYAPRFGWRVYRISSLICGLTVPKELILSVAQTVKGLKTIEFTIKV